MNAARTEQTAPPETQGFNAVKAALEGRGLKVHHGPRPSEAIGDALRKSVDFDLEGFREKETRYLDDLAVTDAERAEARRNIEEWTATLERLDERRKDIVGHLRATRAARREIEDGMLEE